jgi:hypothetical protein
MRRIFFIFTYNPCRTRLFAHDGFFIFAASEAQKNAPERLFQGRKFLYLL